MTKAGMYVSPWLGHVLRLVKTGLLNYCQFLNCLTTIQTCSFFSRSLNKWSKLFPWKWSWLKPRRSLLSTQDLSHETVQKAQLQTSTWNARHPLLDIMSYVNQGDMTLTRSSVWRMNLFTCLGDAVCLLLNQRGGKKRIQTMAPCGWANMWINDKP